MNPDEARFHQLLSQLIDGELSPSERDELASLCDREPIWAEHLRSELELAEMIRQVAQGEPGVAAFSSQLEARFAPSAPVDGDSLIQRLIDDDLDPAGLEALVRHCWRDAVFAARLRRELRQDDLLHQSIAAARSEEAFIEALETRMWAEQAEDHFVDEVASRIVTLHPICENGKPTGIPLHPVFAEIPAPRRQSRFAEALPWIGGWSAAAAAVALLGMAIVFEPEPWAPMESVAEVSRSIDGALWAADGAPVEDRYFVPGRYTLKSGVVTVAFGSGAEMTVEGPADFEVRGEREAFIHSGVALLAKNSAGEGGFSLKTDALDLGEKGDTIGLVANGASSAEAVVFDGGAEICLPKLGFCRNLFAFESVKSDLGREKLFDIPYNPGVFARTWGANAGIQGNTGAVRVAMPGQDPKASGDDKEVQLIVENIRFIADRDVEVDTLDPGHFAAVAPGGGTKLDASGREMRSYLLQWRSGDREASEAGGPLEASVTFDHEIVGVIYTPDRLAGSDSLVGTDNGIGVERAGNRGLDAAAGSDGGDEILLSDDRRTVNLKLNGGGADRLDHVRVLVALR